MSKSFPTQKDEIINDLDDMYGLQLTDEEYGRMRKMTEAELFLITALFSRARRNAI